MYFVNMFGSSTNLITTIIGFGMSATFIVFVCTRLICGRLRRFDDNHMFQIDARVDLHLPENRVNGLEPVVVAAIPTMKFDREAFSSVEDAQCSICLAEYEDKEVLRIMPICGHSFHLSCIDTWLAKQSTCPVCRLSLQDTAETKHTLTAAQSLEGSEIMLQWLLPTAEHTEAATENSERHTDSVAIEVEAEISRETTSRSS